MGVNDLLRAPLHVFAFTDGDRESLEKSASGGAFAALARQVLREGGIVFGAAAEDDGLVHQVHIDSIGDLPRLQGSKYAWSKLEASYDECIECLQDERTVLYSGVPCQIAGLRMRVESSALTDEQKDRLVTCDLICHGTPRTELFQAYISWLSKRHNADDGIHSYQFRTKAYGWGIYYYHYCYFENGIKHEVYGSAGDDPYYYAFSRAATYRQACYQCRYARRERVGDLTLGDYWGVRKSTPKAYDPKGVSAILVNTQKGGSFLNKAASGCSITEVPYDKVNEQQTNLSRPSRRIPKDKDVAEQIDALLKNGNSDEIFERLLPVDQGRNARLRRALPSFALKLLYRLRNNA